MCGFEIRIDEAHNEIRAVIGNPGLFLMEQYLLVISSDKVVKCSYMKSSSIDFKCIQFCLSNEWEFYFDITSVIRASMNLKIRILSAVDR